MAETAGEILQDIVETIRGSGEFAMVTLGQAAAATSVPRAEVICEGQDFSPADDSPSGQFARLRIRVTVHTRVDSPAKAVTRGLELCQTTAEALLADPYRNERCRDLPIGKATEIGRFETVSGSSGVVEMAFTVRCHFSSQEGQP